MAQVARALLSWTSQTNVASPAGFVIGKVTENAVLMLEGHTFQDHRG